MGKGGDVRNREENGTRLAGWPGGCGVVWCAVPLPRLVARRVILADALLPGAKDLATTIRIHVAVSLAVDSVVDVAVSVAVSVAVDMRTLRGTLPWGS